MQESGNSNAVDSIVLEEEIDPNYVPTDSEVLEYAKWLGMDLQQDQDLFWVAREGLMAPLPKNWKPCKTKDTEDIYYFNFSTGESTWDHPCDGYYKRLYEEEKKKKETSMKENNDQLRSKAKQDVDKLLGKGEKKKKKVTTLASNNVTTVPNLVLEKKPLPGISPKPGSIEPLLVKTSLSQTQSSIDTFSLSRNSSTSNNDVSESESGRTSSKSLVSKIKNVASSDDVTFESDSKPTFDETATISVSSTVDTQQKAFNDDEKIYGKNQLNVESGMKVSDIADEALDHNKSKDKTIIDLRLKLRQAESQLDYSAKKIERLTEQQSVLESTIVHDKEILTTTKKELQETESAFKSQIKDLRMEIKKLLDEEDKQLKEIRELKMTIRELESQNLSIKSMKSDNNKNDKVELLEREIKNISEKLNYANDTIKLKNDDIHRLQLDLNEIHQEKLAIYKSNSNSAESSNNDVIVSQLENLIETKNTFINDLSKQLEEKNQLLNVHQQDIATLTALNEQKDKKMNGYKEELLQLQRKHDTPVKQSDNALNMVDNNKEIIGKLNDKVEELTLSLANADSLVIKMGAEMSQINANRSTVEISLNTTIRELEEKNRIVSRENSQLLEEKAELVSQLETIRRENIKVSQKCSLIQEELETLQNEKLQSEIQCRNMEYQVKKYQGEFVSAQSSNESMSVQITNLRSLLEKERENHGKTQIEYEMSKSLYEKKEKALISEQETRINHASNNNNAAIAPSSIIELSMILGKQQIMMQNLEDKLKDAERTITTLRHQTEIPTHRIPEESIQAVKPVASSNVDYSHMIREILDELSKRRQVVPKDNKIGDAVKFQYWIDKIVKEKNFIDDASRMLKKERTSLRTSQDQLNSKRDQWRLSKQKLLSDDEEGKETLATASKLLNIEASKLNEAIERSKRTQIWLKDRTEKLNKMERILSNFSDNRTSNITSHDLNSLAKLESALDKELLDFSADSIISHEKENQYTFIDSKDEKWDNKGVAISQNPNIIRHQIQQMVDHNTYAKDTYEKHASWLDDLRQEIGRFTHGNALQETKQSKKQILSSNVFNV